MLLLVSDKVIAYISLVDKCDLQRLLFAIKYDRCLLSDLDRAHIEEPAATKILIRSLCLHVSPNGLHSLRLTYFLRYVLFIKRSKLH